MKSTIIGALLLFVLGTAKAGEGYELTVWIDKYQINETTPEKFVPIQHHFNFDKKSDIESIYINEEIELGGRVKVIGNDDGFVTYKWELYKRIPGEKWSRVQGDNDLIETMLGSSKLMLQTIDNFDSKSNSLDLQYIVSLDVK